MTIWDAAYLLSEFILFNSGLFVYFVELVKILIIIICLELFHGKDCIELGSGIGLTGFSIDFEMENMIFNQLINEMK